MSGFTEAVDRTAKVDKDMGALRASQGFVCVTKRASLDDKA